MNIYIASKFEENNTLNAYADITNNNNDENYPFFRIKMNLFSII